MKKILTFLTIFLSFPASALAQTIGISRANKPGNIPLNTTLGNIIANVLQIMFIIGGLGALIFLVWGSLDWILAGGDKEKLAAARKKIINSIIGLVLLALSVFIVELIGQVVGIDILNLEELPTLYDVPVPPLPPNETT